MPTAEPIRALLDTHAFLWLAAGDSRVSTELRARLADSRSELWLSGASVWEMAIKKSLGKLRLTLPLGELITVQSERMRLQLLPIGTEHALAVENLPFHHRDPFDRILVAQALEEDLTLVSGDEAMAPYPVHRLW